MTLIVGLGNPGPEYAGTRHNAGFLVVERFAGPSASWRRAYHGHFTTIEVGTQRVSLLKPDTFMNRSGESVAEARTVLGVPAEAVLIVHDELDLPFGQVRLKQGGGHAGHNGLKSVAATLGTGDFCRLRVGIGRPGAEFSGAIADYVLSGFAAEELTLLPDVLDEGSQALGLAIRLGLAAAMNQVNRRARAAKPTESDQNH